MSDFRRLRSRGTRACRAATALHSSAGARAPPVVATHRSHFWSNGKERFAFRSRQDGESRYNAAGSVADRDRSSVVKRASEGSFSTRNRSRSRKSKSGNGSNGSRTCSPRARRSPAARASASAKAAWMPTTPVRSPSFPHIFFQSPSRSLRSSSDGPHRRRVRPGGNRRSQGPHHHFSRSLLQTRAILKGIHSSPPFVVLYDSTTADRWARLGNAIVYSQQYSNQSRKLCHVRTRRRLSNQHHHRPHYPPRASRCPRRSHALPLSARSDRPLYPQRCRPPT